MQDFLKKYHIEAEALTPIFIGGGASVDISKQNYYVDDNEKKIYVINMPNFMKFIIKNSTLMKAYENFIKSDMTLNQFLNTNYGKSISIEDIKNKYCNNIIDINDADIRGGAKQINANRSNDKTNNISGFIKDSEGNAYMPGSSIKGAIRTILLKYELLQDKNKNYDHEINSVMERPRTDVYKKVEQDYFNTLGKLAAKENDKKNAVNDKMSDLYVGDSNIIKDELMLCEKIDMNSKGEEKNLGALFRECIKPKTKIEFDIVLKDNVFNVEDILEKIKENVKLYHDNYINNYDKKCVYNDLFIPIGGGVGFLSKTFTLEASNNKEAGVKNISKILSKQFPKHKHEFDYKDGFAPKLRKMGECNGKLYDMGLLAIKKVIEVKSGVEIPIPQVF